MFLSRRSEGCKFLHQEEEEIMPHKMSVAEENGNPGECERIYKRKIKIRNSCRKTEKRQVQLNKDNKIRI